jgi:lysosomal alpha-mannosidase
LNYRATWPLINDEPVSGNYYPLNSHIAFIDAHTQQRLSLLVDRSQGGTVISDGVL